MFIFAFDMFLNSEDLKLKSTDLERDFNASQEIIRCFSSGRMQSFFNELAQAT